MLKSEHSSKIKKLCVEVQAEVCAKEGGGKFMQKC